MWKCEYFHSEKAYLKTAVVQSANAGFKAARWLQIQPLGSRLCKQTPRHWLPELRNDIQLVVMHALFSH